jgi:mersacidin/lichenicidin family type 2 lantibiotic
MSKNNIIRAWKDPAYRNSLSAAERAALPANPAGAIEISDADLGKVSGGRINLSALGICRSGNCSIVCTQNQCLTNFMACLSVLGC